MIVTFQQTRKILASQAMRVCSVSLLFCVCAGCGAAGPPIAPEEVGLEAKIREQRQPPPQRGEDGELLVPIEEESVKLPVLRPVGSR
ncbi:MAG: hypothetical protein NPIRA05_11150 [Nitrospirales bacterium]|nr:MAG: hypothetical protein NPIRA05_11150 [Nitrospirales bacterium]